MDKIVIIGAGDFQKPLINKAKEMGYETHVFAWRAGDAGEKLADHFYPISVVNRDQVLRECRKIRPKAVVTIASDIATRTANYVAEQLGLVSNGEQVLSQMKDKCQMRQVLQTAGLPQPGYVVVTDEFSLEMLDGLVPPYIVKPIDRTNARGITVVTDQKRMMEAINHAREYSFTGGAIVETFVKGQEFSCDTISFQGNHQIVSFTQVETKGQKPYRLIQPVHLDGRERERYADLIVKTLDSFGIRFGAAHIELMVDQQGQAHILEVSETTGSDYISSDLIPLTTGYDYLKAVVDVACGRAPEDVSSRQLGMAELRYLRSEEDLLELHRLEREKPKELYRVNVSGEHMGLGDSYILYRPAIEMGSFLPLELAVGKDWFSGCDASCLRALNSPATALWYAMQALQTQDIWLPSYYAPKMIRQAQATIGVEHVHFYSLNSELMPQALPEKGTVVLVDYFGVMGERLSALAESLDHVILDRTSAFYSAPLMREGVMNIYSCTAFFGVPDGAYLIGQELPELLLERDSSHERAGYLLKALEEGTSAAYRDRAANESAVAEKHLAMSNLTMRMMDSIDYDAIAQKRVSNYLALEKAFSEKLPETFKLTKGCVPQCFPLIADSHLRKELTIRKIYVPQLWKRNAQGADADTLEHDLAESLCPLPVDQRYGTAEMEYMIRVIREILPHDQ